MRFAQVRLPSTARGAANPRAVVLIGALAIVIAVVVWVFYPRPERDGLPEPGIVDTTEEERGDAARELIAEMMASSSPDYAAAVERGRDFAEQGRLADAQLLYFFAARGGSAAAAYELGRMYDPATFSAETSLMEDPDPFQAYKWYSQASEGGVAEAEERLAELRAWTEREAAAGNLQAEQLLVQWD